VIVQDVLVEVGGRVHRVPREVGERMAAVAFDGSESDPKRVARVLAEWHMEVAGVEPDSDTIDQHARRLAFGPPPFKITEVQP
jgi:hypothetical protein